METVHAQLAQTSVVELGTTFGLATADLELTVVRIVQWTLALLELISLLYVVAGGMRWIISGENDEFKQRAKRMLLSGLFGNVIVLLAWAIVTFLFGTVQNVTS